MTAGPSACSTSLDEFTRESLAIRVRRKLSSIDVIDLLTDLFILRDELLNGEIFCTLKEAQVLIESRRRHYNAIRPHSSLGYRVPAQDERGARAPPLFKSTRATVIRLAETQPRCRSEPDPVRRPDGYRKPY